MNQRTEFIAFTDQAVLKAPIALRQYVEWFFRKKMIFGTDCWIALRVVGLCPRARNTGVAPLLNTGVDHFTGELPEGMQLSDLIRELEKDPQRCFSFFVEWDDGKK